MLSTFNIPRTYFMRCLVVFTLMALAWCSTLEDADVTERDGAQTEYPQGIARLLFKHMRFRDLPEISEPKDEQFEEPGFSGSWSQRFSDPDVNPSQSSFYRSSRNPSANNYVKRHQQENLVNSLAALLADGRGKSSGSTLRMPSLRFG